MGTVTVFRIDRDGVMGGLDSKNPERQAQWKASFFADFLNVEFGRISCVQITPSLISIILSLRNE